MRRVIFLVPLLLLAGCGSVDGREQAATDTAVRMLDAVAAGDGAAACAVLAPDTASAVSDSDCPAAILGEHLAAPGRVVGTDVYGQWAQVRLAGDTVFLAVFPGGWRVVAAGCTPQGQKPYDCAVEGD
ncbi:MAG TPA: hypothetical protein VFW27_15015 [Actinoplanes sp.]|jgi:ketosteroid isomerase-like protein|nr:hypothetical protein [Actinoplanes sp.]